MTKSRDKMIPGTLNVLVLKWYCQVKSKSPRNARSMNANTHTQRALHLGPGSLIRPESS